MSTDHLPKAAIPFSVGDFFIYLIPGATFLLAILGFEYREAVWEVVVPGNHIHLPAYRVASDVAQKLLEKGDAVLTTSLLLVLFIAAYVAGHLISSVSSLGIDRVLIFKGHQYPHAYLLHPKATSPTLNYSQVYYRGLFFWANLALVFGYLLGVGWFERGGKLWVLSCAVFVTATAATVLGTAIKVIVDAGRSVDYDKSLARMRPLNRRLVRVFSAPYDVVADLYADFTHSQQPLSEPVRGHVAARLKKLFGINTPSDSESYWFAYMYVLTTSPELAARILNWLHLYEFARNLSSAFYMAGLYCGLLLVLNRPSMAQLDTVAFSIPLVLFSLAVVMMARFYYLYVCYYSKFVFRSFAYLACVDTAASASSRGTVDQFSGK